MSDESSVELSDAIVERVAGRLAELVAPRLLTHTTPASPRDHASEGEGSGSQGEKHIQRGLFVLSGVQGPGIEFDLAT